MIAGVIVIGALVGAVGGVITARLKGDLSAGAIVTAGTHVLVVVLLESEWKIALFGMLPLLLTFVVGSVTTRRLELRFGMRPVVSSLAAFGIALFVAFLYLMPIRLGWMSLTNLGTLWIAGALLSCLIILSIRKRFRAAK